MAHSGAFLPMDRRYCSAVLALNKFPCSSAFPAVHPCCRNSFTVHPAWITKLGPLRCHCIGCCLPSCGSAWQRLSTSQSIPVLVRGEHDGFYYRGTIKKEMENERGMFLVEFTRPLQTHGRHSVYVQKTAKDDILEYANGMKHSLLPGDKVLAPWEPDLVRYGPGTVLMGTEMRDPLRASEDEDILVQFWNDKQVKLPRGVALWIPPSLCGRIVEMIHMPFSSRLSCLGHPDVWWPLLPKSQVCQREAEKAEPRSKSSPCLLELEGQKQEELAAVTARSPSADSEGDSEPFPTQSSAVKSTVNTDSSSPDKPRLKESARPKWKYWKRSHCKSHASNSGIGSHSSTCTEGKLESRAISVVDMSRVAPPDQRAVFEATEQPPRGRFAMKGTVRYQDSKLSSGVRQACSVFAKCHVYAMLTCFAF
ncbi:UNVERIFIED_CONTAM: hypothetical protein H355_016310 [Colinus virginianus]|nr:hypothetical protein H355_016310 [Colinus virginianus]